MKMKKTKILGLVLALIMFFTNLPFGSGIVHAQGEEEYVEINFKNFPDEKFFDYVSEKIDTILRDGKLSKAEREAVKDLNLNTPYEENSKYQKLVGIKYFPNLQKLTCTGNEIIELNLSENKNLTYLDCSNNDIRSLNISQCKDLTYLNCSRNNLNSNIDVSNNTELKDLICGRNGDMQLNLENNIKLQNLDLSGGRIPTIDLSKNLDLRTLNCNSGWVTKLDLSKNPELTELYCNENYSLDKLDLRNNNKLTKITSFNSPVKELLLPENNEIKEIDCDRNQLTELDLSSSPKLTKLKCQNNQLKKLDVSNNPELTELYCNENQITSLDLSNNTKLKSFNGRDQKYDLTIIKGRRVIEKNDLPDGFDFSKVTGKVENATVDGDSFKLKANVKYITYEYNVGVAGLSNLTCRININHYVNMKVKQDPKLVYKEGENLDLSGLIVTLVDGDGKETDVPFKDFQHYNIQTNYNDKTELIRADHNGRKIEISVEALNAETTGTLTVNERKFDPNNVVEIKVKTPPTIMKYTEGNELNLAGLEVTLIDNYKKQKDVPLKDFDTFNITTEPANNTVLTMDHNGTAIIVNKGGLEASTNESLTVTAKAFDPDHVTKIEVKTHPTKLEYTEGDNLVLDGLEVTLTDSFGKTKDVKFEKFGDYGINAEPANETKLTVAGHNGKPVIVTKGNLDPAKTKNLTVKERVFDPNNVESIVVTKEPTKLVYTEEEPLELDGLVVTLTDNKGTTKEVPFANFETYDLVATPANETALTVADHNGETVKITKGNLSAKTAALTVNSKDFNLDNVVTIEILNQPSKMSYTEGEKLNLAGLKVRLTDNIDKIKEVVFEAFEENGITTEPANETKLTVDNNGKAVKITKGKANTDTDPLTVNPKVFDKEHIASIVVKTQPKLDYTEDDNLNLSELEVTLTDNQGLTEDVAFEKFVDYGLTATPANETKLTVADHDGKTIIIEKGNVSGKTNALTVKAKANPPEPTDPKIIGPVDSSQAPADIENYFVIKFESSNEEQGTVAVENLVYVPKTLSSKTLADIKAPEVTAKPGYEFEKWSLPINTAIDKNLTVKAIFKAQGTVNPPVEPSIPSDNIIGPVDSESDLYKELDKHKDEYYKLVFDDNDYTSFYVLFVKRGQGIRFTDIAAYAPNVVADEGYVFTGWSPMLYGNTELIENDRYIVAEFEEIGRPYRPYWPDYREERPYRPYRPYRHYEDDSDTEPVVEEKPVEVNEYDKLEAILFINDSIMQKSVNGVVSRVRMDIAPFIYQARTMLPIRYVAESLGFMVTWDANTRTVYLVDKENIVQIPVDTNNIIVNGKAFVSDVKPMIKNNRTMLPVANVARALGLQDGKDILWDAAMKFVTLRRNVLK